MGHVQGAFATQLAIDAVFIDETEHQGWRSPQHAVELAAHRLAEPGLDVIRRDPQPGVHQADVAPRPALPGPMGFQHSHALALFEQVHRRRQPGEACADHTDIHRDFTGERRIFRPLRRQFFPQTFFA
jgi:hypothetical protein